MSRYGGMPGRRLLVAALAVYVGWLATAYSYHVLDGVNLVFHEAGHLVFGLLGPTAHFLGGTLGQLFFPIACALHFLRQGKRFESHVMGIWLAESLMNVARYLGDAQAQSLPLVGGHVHDWNWLLARWGLLSSCETIATVLHAVAVGIGVGSLIGAWANTGPGLDHPGDLAAGGALPRGRR